MKKKKKKPKTKNERNQRKIGCDKGQLNNRFVADWACILLGMEFAVCSFRLCGCSGITVGFFTHPPRPEETAGSFTLANGDGHQVDRDVGNEDLVDERILAMPIVKAREQRVVASGVTSTTIHQLCGAVDAVSIESDVVFLV